MLNSDELTDTIAAVATPQGRGGVGVIRISGPQVHAIASQLLGQVPKPRQAMLKKFQHPSGEVMDMGLALYFPKPNSFTGEDVLELQGHGGPVIMDMLLTVVLQHGARIALPGEFTQRAFLNGKMDLAQAEAVADLIEASTEQAALSASRSMQGVFSAKIESLANELMHLRMYVEAAIDFPEEEVDFLSEGHILEKIKDVIAKIHALQNGAKLGQMLKDGMSVAIVGQPNAGKSSLLNRLTQHETAIVTPFPGTTRDLIKETIQVGGFPVHIVDTAGIRDEADMIEAEGIKRAKNAARLADRVLLVVDSSKPMPFSDIETAILEEFTAKVAVVMNKIDLVVGTKQDVNLFCSERIYLSAKTGQGMGALLDHLKICIGCQGQEGSFIARRRHLEALNKTYTHCQQAQIQLVEFKAGELVAQELRLAQAALAEIVGKVTTDDLLGQIFASFCIGK